MQVTFEGFAVPPEGWTAEDVMNLLVEWGIRLYQETGVAVAIMIEEEAHEASQAAA